MAPDNQALPPRLTLLMSGDSRHHPFSLALRLEPNTQQAEQSGRTQAAKGSRCFPGMKPCSELYGAERTPITPSTETLWRDSPRNLVGDPSLPHPRRPTLPASLVLPTSRKSR